MERVRLNTFNVHLGCKNTIQIELKLHPTNRNRIRDVGKKVDIKPRAK